MIPPSLTVILATLALGVVALAAFIAAWRRGYFRQMDAQARVPMNLTLGGMVL